MTTEKFLINISDTAHTKPLSKIYNAISWRHISFSRRILLYGVSQCSTTICIPITFGEFYTFKRHSQVFYHHHMMGRKATGTQYGTVKSSVLSMHSIVFVRQNSLLQFLCMCVLTVQCNVSVGTSNLLTLLQPKSHVLLVHDRNWF